MRALVVRSADPSVSPCSLGKRADAVSTAVFGEPVVFAIEEVEPPEFDSNSEACANHVQVRVAAFALNYRDRSWIVDRARQTALPARDRVVGSEFAGAVVAVGANVDGFRIGDRVMADMSWPVSGSSGVLPGVPTNAASGEIQNFHHSKLVHVPTDMQEADAAAFVLCAQTGHALARRAEIEPGDSVLITAATSNTSLLALQSLNAIGAQVHGITRSMEASRQLESLGYARVFAAADVLDPGSSLFRQAGEIGGYRAIIDPFSDVYLQAALTVLGFFGRYVTCGVMDQVRHAAPVPVHLDRMLNQIIVKNLTIRGNCLGLRSDLEGALQLWSQARLRPIIDSVHCDVRGFIDRTFADDRFGKVIFSYGTSASNGTG